MTPGARVAAAIEIIDEISRGQATERALTVWARSHRFAGSKDRAAIRDLVFDLRRRWRSCAARGGGQSGRARMIGLLRQQGADLAAAFSGEGYAPAPLRDHERLDEGRTAPDLPDWLMPAFRAALGPHLDAVLEAQRHRAPLWLRVNLARSGRTAVQEALRAEGIATRRCGNVKTALEVTGNTRKVAGSSALSEGLIEIQDVASQAAAAGIPLSPGARVLDLCAGGGGKALALADRAAAAGLDVRIHVHDAAPGRMADLPRRARRAGVTLTSVSTRDLAVAAPFDVVVADVPCSGSGAWARSPDGKWTLTPQRLTELAEAQARILLQAAGLTCPGGILAYLTCSVLTCENGAQIEHFLGGRPGWRETDRRSWLPDGRGDGFFAAMLQAPVATG